ncbi:MAG TPA: ArsA-related P-loop ATPase [Polyangiaceae bacterium]|nr:ArsA-related P-loop ATPase [Polyangiaceae bacterium]
MTFVTGKGGVGKSTVAGALALRAAREGARAALVEFDDGEAGARALRGADAEVGHVVVDYDAALEEAVAGVLGGALMARTLLGHGAVRRLVKAMPALREFVSLEKVRSLVAAGAFDRVVVDLPASGHAVDWLRVPGAFERFLLGGPLGALGRRLREELIAEGKSDLVLVTLAEPLVMRETEDLAGRLRGELGRGATLVVVNRVARPDPPGAAEAAERLASAAPGVAAPASFAGLLRARSALASEGTRALAMARAVEAAALAALPEAAADPPAVDVARWLEEGALAA